MSGEDPRPFRTREEMEAHLDQLVRDRKDERCDVPDCQRRWKAVRKLTWIQDTGLRPFVVLFFVCPKHLAMPRKQFLKAAPTGIPEMDDAPAVDDVAPFN